MAPHASPLRSTRRGTNRYWIVSSHGFKGDTMPISQKIKDLIYNAWTDGAPCLLATQGPNGPNISPKGSMLVYDDEHLAYWERSRRQALENLDHDRRVAVIYANFKAQRDGVLESGFLRFYGTAELHESGPVREADRKSTRLNSSHIQKSRMPSSA